MSISFRPAVRENVSVIVGLIGPSGSGKTYTALELATGIAEVTGSKVGFIDTENGRASHYADQFRFDVAELGAPFRPDAYAVAIMGAAKAGYNPVVVDSMSHEHYGEGGLLDWHEEEFQRMGGRDAVKMAAWIKPKMSHKKMVQKLLQVKAHIIMCFRAEEKIKMVPNPKKKGKVEPTNIGWQPICEKNLPYELTTSLLFEPERPGMPVPLKLQKQHQVLFPTGQVVTRAAGIGLAEWAAGGVKAQADRVNEAPGLRPEIEDALVCINLAASLAELKKVAKSLASLSLTAADHQALDGPYKTKLDSFEKMEKENG